MSVAMTTGKKLALVIVLAATIMLISAQEAFAAKANRLSIDFTTNGSMCGYTGTIRIKGFVSSTAVDNNDGKIVLHAKKQLSFWDSSGKLLGHLSYVEQKVISTNDLPSTLNFNLVVTCVGNGHIHNSHWGWTVGKSGLVEAVHFVGI